MGTYTLNAETQKLEMYFNKAEYMNLPETDKQNIKSNYLFSRRSGAWISRAKYPNTYSAEKVAKSLGLTYEGMQGEVISFEEMQERKAERAEARAEWYEARAENASQRADALQKPINDLHGDVAFFTQPNINTSAGRVFTNYRNRLFSAYERGIDEFKKSQYYAEAAEKARQTAADTKPKDKGFCARRIEEAKKLIKGLNQSLERYHSMLERVQNGEVIKYWNGDLMTEESITETIDRTEMQLESAIGKEAYYTAILDELGGVTYNKNNIKPGDKVRLFGRPWIAEVIKCNPTTIRYNSGCGFSLTAKYAEIQEVIDDNGAAGTTDNT